MECPTKEHIRVLESNDKQMQSQFDLEMEQMQQFLRELNLKVTTATEKLKSVNEAPQPTQKAA